MSGSGVRIGMIKSITGGVLPGILKDLLSVPYGWTAAAVGSAVRAIAFRLSVRATTLPSATSTWECAWPGRCKKRKKKEDRHRPSSPFFPLLPVKFRTGISKYRRICYNRKSNTAGKFNSNAGGDHMPKNKVDDIINRINRETGKFYAFQESHNPQLPADHWFQNPPEGLTLFLVLYTRACRWARCLGCSLPSLESKFDIPFNDIMKQVDYTFDFLLSREQKDNLKKIILSNNGSVLDEATFSTTALLYFIAKMNMSCPYISLLTLETRPEYVDLAELEVLHRALQEGQTAANLELAVGFEAYDEKIRNDYFRKGLSREVFEAMVEKIAKYGFKLKTYFMLKPVPGFSDEEAIVDIVNGVDYLDTLAKKYNIEINMHLNPTYVSRGTGLETEFRKGNYEPPMLESVLKAARSAERKQISLYVGLNDEGLSVPGGSFIREGDEELLEKLQNFNHTSDFSFLK